MQFKKLKINNYRSIEKAELEFSSGINIIIGDSQTGKSNIQRLIRDWAFNNTGDDFVTVNADKTQIEIDGVLWEKGKEKSKKINRYSFNDNIYDNVGRTVPEPITEYTQIVKIDFGGSDAISLNFIDQHSSFFMIFNSKSDNAKILGRIAGINRIYKCTKTTSQRLKTKKALLLNYNVLLETEKEEFKKYDYLHNAESALQKVGNRINVVNKKEKEIKDLKIKLENFKKLSKDLLQIKLKLNTLTILESININDLETKITKLNILKSLFKEYKVLLTRLTSIDINKYNILTDNLFLKTVIFIDDKQEKLEILKERLKKYDNNKREYNSILLNLQTAENTLGDCKKELDDFVNDITICPITQLPMPEECKEKIQ